MATTLTCPKGLSPFARAAWRRVLTELEDRGDLRPSDAPALERYARAVDVARRCWDELGGSLTARGSMGQPVVDPMMDAALKAEKAAAEFAKALGVEPAARLPKNVGGRPQGRMVAKQGGSGEPPKVVPLRRAS